ncbi:MAG TPA: hypothetical protein DEA97_08810 [Bacteroidales bacterium]|nr:hypothetical protein [Bacteroidales bacterium]
MGGIIMKTKFFLFISILSSLQLIGQWTIVDSSIQSNDVIHYKDPCVFVSKYSDPKGIKVNCENADTFTFVSYAAFDAYGVSSIESYEDTIFCTTHHRELCFSTDNGLTWNLYNDICPGCYKLFRNKEYLYTIGDTLIGTENWRYNFFTGEIIPLILPEGSFYAFCAYFRNDEFYLSSDDWPGTTGDSDGILLRSTDNGDTWTEIYREIPPFNPIIRAITKVTDNILIIAGQWGMKKSYNNGETFQNVPNYWQSEIRDLICEDGYLLLSTDSGACVSYDTTTTFQDFNEGFVNPIKVSKIKKAGNYLYAVTDHGLWKRPWSDVAGIDGPAIKPQIAVYPVPAKETINIVLNGNTALTTKITLYDCLGRPIQSMSEKGSEFMMDVSGLPSGVYFVKICTNEFEVTEKVLVE